MFSSSYCGRRLQLWAKKGREWVAKEDSCFRVQIQNRTKMFYLTKRPCQCCKIRSQANRTYSWAVYLRLAKEDKPPCNSSKRCSRSNKWLTTRFSMEFQMQLLHLRMGSPKAQTQPKINKFITRTTWLRSFWRKDKWVELRKMENSQRDLWPLQFLRMPNPVQTWLVEYNPNKAL